MWFRTNIEILDLPQKSLFSIFFWTFHILNKLNIVKWFLLYPEYCMRQVIMKVIQIFSLIVMVITTALFTLCKYAFDQYVVLI